MTPSKKTNEFENLQINKKSNEQFTITEIGSAPAFTTSGNDYVIFLINMSNTCFEMIRTRNPGMPWSKWWPMPLTCRTCSLGSYSDCFNAKAWRQILVTNCNSGSFDIQIATKPDANGNAIGATWEGISPNCNYGGGAIAVE
jgi:hypothetical protein